VDQPTQYLAFDLGAASGRTFLGTIHEEHLDMEEIHRFSTPLIKVKDHLYWDVDVIWKELQKGLRKAIQKSKNLCSLSVSSWGVDYIPLDANGRALRNAYSYRDSRSSSMMEEVHSKLSEAEFYRITGIKSMPINTLYQIYWDHKYEPELFKKTAYRLTIADYFNYRFGGRMAVEKSLASTSQLLDVKSGVWALDILRQLDLSLDAYPEIVPSGTILGNTQEYPSIQVIATCSHDTACAVASVPAMIDGPGWAFLSSGTWSLLGVERSKPVLTDEARQAGFTNESGVGNSILFLKNLNGLWVLQECEKEWQEAGQSHSYDRLLNEVKSFAESNAMPIVDLNQPQFGEPGNMVSKLYKACDKQDFSITHTHGAVVATILMSLARSYADTMKMLIQITGQPIEILHLVGGGTKNQLLCQWTADACGCKVLAGPDEATAIGNILLQAQVLGKLPSDNSMRDIARKFARITTYLPRENRDQKKDNLSE
jgi:rhamnulokinase